MSIIDWDAWYRWIDGLIAEEKKKLKKARAAVTSPNGE
jgi:hypothetical protein